MRLHKFDPKDFFKAGVWYKGHVDRGDKGIIVKCLVDGGGTKNHGFIDGDYCDLLNLLTPRNWEEITDPEIIKHLEEKLLNATKN